MQSVETLGVSQNSRIAFVAHRLNDLGDRRLNSLILFIFPSKQARKSLGEIRLGAIKAIDGEQLQARWTHRVSKAFK
jgi:hypothetical protein